MRATQPTTVRRALALAVLAVAVAGSGLQGQEASDPTLATFSIVACDQTDGFWGVGIQSRVVGAGSIVPAAQAGVGAIATQAAANVAFKGLGLELLREGLTADEVRQRFIEVDPGHARRQFAVVDRHCGVAAFTGEGTTAWAGHRTGPGYSVQGNILAGAGVIDAMAAAYERAEADGVPFGERILAALKAGQDAGGDVRGRQGAGLLIVRAGGGYGGGDDRYADLRVEDHVEPILELERVYDVWMSLFHPADHFMPRGGKPIPVARGPHICQLRELLARAGHGTPPEPGRPCAYDDEVIAALKAFQRAEGLPVRPDLTPATRDRLRERASISQP
jgi:uncharacterized Ntn-hydrolase superfamily protein